MNPEMLTGRSVRGAIAYITHDAPSDDNPRPTTAGRVAWTHCLNLPSDNPELAGRIMQGTIYDAPALKRLAGLSNRGRKLTEPALHLILSWRHDESPLPPHLQSLLNDKPELRAGLTKYAAIETTLSALKELGIEDHQVVLACHTDKDHLHVHAVANRVHPDTGRAAKLSHSKRILNRWAEQYEVERGQVVTPNRIARREAITERQQARAEGRELPPMPPKQPKRGPGRREQTVDERRVWAQMREAQKSDTDTTAEEKRAQRGEVARLLGQLNETARAPAPTVEVPAPVAVPVRPRVPTPATELPPAPSVQVPEPVVVPVRPRVPTPAAVLPPAPSVQVPEPVVVPVRPRVPTPAAELPPAPSVQVPEPVAVPIRPRVPTPAAELPPAPSVQVPEPVTVPVRPRVPIPDTGSRSPSGTWQTAAQLLAWLLDHLLRLIWTRDGGGDGLPGGGSATPPKTDTAESAADVSEKKRRTEDLLRRHGMSAENQDNLVGGKLRKNAGKGVGAECPAQQRLPPGPARDPTRDR